MYKDLIQDFQKAETAGGYFDLSAWKFIHIAGPDSADFLHRLSTIDFKKFDSSTVHQGAFLTGKGGVVSIGAFEELAKNEFLYVVPPSCAQSTIEHLEKFHFSEDLAFQLVSNWNLFAVHKNAVSKLPLKDLEQNVRHTTSIENISITYCCHGTQPDLFWVRVPSSESLFEKTNLDLLGEELFKFYRIQAGIPLAGEEIGIENIVLEANFESAIDREKGCYPGQEVVERIFTYGQVNRKLYNVKVDGTPSELPTPLIVDSKEAGTLVASTPDPRTEGKAIGLAYIRRNYWDTNKFAGDADLKVERL